MSFCILRAGRLPRLVAILMYALLGSGAAVAAMADPPRKAAPDEKDRRYVGMEYEVWFPGIPAEGRYGGERYWLSRWGTPLLGTYDSADPKIIDRHAAWLTEIGIDFVLIDWANNIANALTGATVIGRTIRSRTKAVFAEYRRLEQRGVPHPKLAILVGAENQNGIAAEQAISSGELTAEANYVYQHLIGPAPNLYFSFAGKPLLVIYIGAPAAFKRPPGWSDPRFTVRWMSGYLESQPSLYGGNPNTNVFWSWLDRLPVPAHAKGKVEAITVTQAYPGQKSWFDTTDWPPARGRVGADGITTFSVQWQDAVTHDPQIILLNQWNEFSSQNRTGPGTGDEYSTRSSNDLEPTRELACAPITAVQTAVANWKKTSPRPIDCTLSGPASTARAASRGGTVLNSNSKAR